MRLLLVFLALVPGWLAGAGAVPVGSYVWAVDDPLFGGFSAIEMSSDGSSFIAVSDRGAFITGVIDRVDGRITGITAGPLVRMRGPGMRPLTRAESDSEGLAIGPDDRIHISFEGVQGIRSFAAIDQAGSLLVTGPLFDSLQPNAGLEALAIDAQGTLFAIPERSGAADIPFAVYRLRDAVWDEAFSIPRRGAFLVVGADIGPDGQLYVLERDFVGIGFRTRVRRFDMQGGDERMIMQSRLGQYDNLEGISIWDDGAGLRMTLIADDNFRRFQRTEIVEYRLTD